MQMPVKRWFTFVEETVAPAGGELLRKVAVVAVVANPYAGRYVEDLKPLIDASVELGRLMAERGLQAAETHAWLESLARTVPTGASCGVNAALLAGAPAPYFFTGRQRRLRSVPADCQVARPSGTFSSISPERMEIL